MGPPARLKILWIPFWSTYNLHLLDDYRDYFDPAFLQPNYMFYKGARASRRPPGPARGARGSRWSTTLSWTSRLASPERHSRFRDYLNGGVTHGYMREAACAHFQGVGALEAMRVHPDPREREFYDDIYAFVKGRYRVKPPLLRR